MKTFNDGRCVDEISPAQHAHEVRVELGDLYPGRPVHFVRERLGQQQQRRRQKKGTCAKKKNRQRGGGKESEDALTVEALRAFTLGAAHHLRKVKK